VEFFSTTSIDVMMSRLRNTTRLVWEPRTFPIVGCTNCNGNKCKPNIRLVVVSNSANINESSLGGHVSNAWLRTEDRISDAKSKKQFSVLSLIDHP